MKTTLSPERLAELIAAGVAEARSCPFVNPHAIAQAGDVLASRGEEWAESVLLRKLTRRSIAYPSLPWFEVGELETLILADRDEWESLEWSPR